MALTPELLRALAIAPPANFLGDAPNLDLDLTDPIRAPLEQVASRNPTLAALLGADALDPLTQHFLVQQDDLRIQKARLNERIMRLEEDIAGEQPPSPVDPERGLIAWLGPIPLGLQVGTFLGIENPVARFAVDFLADPLLLLGGIGGLTKLGHGVKFLNTMGRALTPLEKARSLMNAGRVIARSSIDDGLKRAMKQSATKAMRPGVSRREGIDELSKMFKDFSKTPLSTAEMTQIEGLDPDLARLLRGEKAAIKEFKSAFTLIDENVKVEQASGFLDALVKGQRGVINLGIPFTNFRLGDFSFPTIAKILAGQETVGNVARRTFGETAEAARGTFSQEALHMTKGIDIRDREAVLGGLENTFESYLKTLDREAIPQGFMSEGQDIATAFSRNMNSVELNAKEARHGLRLVVETPEARKTLRTIMDNPQTERLADDPRFLALPDRHQRTALALEKTFQEAGKLAVDERVISDMIDHYVPRFFKKKFEPGQEDLHMIFFRKHAQDLDPEVLKRLRKGVKGVEDIDPGDVESLMSAAVKVLYMKKSDLPKSRHAFHRLFATLDDVARHLKKHPGAFEVVSEDLADLTAWGLESLGKAVARNQLIDVSRFARVKDPVLEAIGTSEEFLKRFQATGLNRAVLYDEDIKFLKSQLTRQQQHQVVDRYRKLDNPTFAGIKFHKEIFPMAQVLFERDAIKDFTRGGGLVRRSANALYRLNVAMKTTLFSLNPAFHTVAMTLSQLALLPMRAAARGIAEAASLAPAAYRGTPEAVSELALRTLTRTPEGVDAKDFLDSMKRSGLKLGAFQDVEEGYGVIHDTMTKLARVEAPLFKDVFTGLDHFNAWNDRFLWGVVQNTYKTNAWAHIRKAELDKFVQKYGPDNLSPKAQLQIETEAANIVNPGFGGLAWEMLGASKTAQTAMRLLLLAPDWTISNLKMGVDLVFNMPGPIGEAIRRTRVGQFLTSDVILRDMRFRWALQYNLRAGIYTFLASNLANYAFTKYRTGKGRWLWENDEESFDEKTGMKSRIELPWLREDGRRQFMDISRQYTEPWSWVVSPLDSFRRKMGSLPRTLSPIITGVDSFGRMIRGSKDGPYQEIIKLIGETSGQFMPITVNNLERLATDALTPGAFALSVGGFPVRTETKRGFENRARLAEWRRRLQEVSQ